MCLYPSFGLARSFSGRVWRERLDLIGAGQAQAMGALYGVPDLLARVLAGRGVEATKAEGFLQPKLRDLMPDPLVLRDMEQATQVLADFIARSATIAVFGDYDVDGAASAALLCDYLRQADCPFVLHIPDRITEGYGPNKEAIEALYQSGARLLVCVDCGTSAFEPLAHAHVFGMQTIVLDHHQANTQLPEGLVVNPNRQDDLSGLGALCAAGVVHLTLVSLGRELRQRGFWTPTRPAPDLMAALDLVALATVADVAQLTGLNRAYVRRGLEIARRRERVGLRALMDVAGANGPPNTYQFGFLLGPRINAGGRIGDSALGAKLLLLGDETEAMQVATTLDRLNRERRDLEMQAVEEAKAQALAELGLDAQSDDIPPVLVTGSQDWHPGIVGLVAARLREHFGVPSFALAYHNDKSTGSGRSITGVDLGFAVARAVEAGILQKGGGHAMAAGVSLQRDRIAEFTAFLQENLRAAVAKARAEEALLIDGAVSAGALNIDFVHALEQAGPFGAGHSEPLFVLPRHRLVQADCVGSQHLRLRAQAGDGSTVDMIAFRAIGTPLGEALQKLRGEEMHFVVSLAIDHYRGRERVQARLVDAGQGDFLP